ncbi:MAG: kelch repeat-containing protein [Candidatus Binataceae bacterium]
MLKLLHLRVLLAVLSLAVAAPLRALATPLQTRAVVAATPTPTPTPTRTPTPKPTATPAIVTLSGTAVQGPMAWTTVLVYAVNTTNGSNGAILGGSLADGNGNFTIKMTHPAGPVRLLADGGTYVSEMNGATIYTPADISALLGSVAGNISGISINPLSNFVDSMTVGKLKAGGITFANALAGATANIEKFYGLTTDPARIIPNYTSSGLNTDAGNLGLVLGALINEDQALCPKQPGGLVTALAADIADGVYNGLNFGSAITYCSKQKLTALAGTIDFEDALSGTAQLANITRAFAFGGRGNILTANQIANVASNGTRAYPVAPLAKINSAIVGAAPAPVNKFAPSGGTATMTTAREAPTATLLPNGKVLIAGGVNSPGQAMASAETYDPLTNRFTALGNPMNTARFDAVATLLPNGKALIAGGFTSTLALGTGDLYDPALQTFTPTFNLTDARYQTSIALAPNGLALLLGGNDNTAFNSTAAVDTFDPARNCFIGDGGACGLTPPKSLLIARKAATATLLPNGGILVAGGIGLFGSPMATAEVYNPATGLSAATANNMNSVRAFATATLLPNGKVLIAGGYGTSEASPNNSVDIYDPATNEFAPVSATPSMNVGRAVAAAILLPNGKVLIAGGTALSSHATASIEIYDPVHNCFMGATGCGSLPPNMNAARLGATITLLPNGKVLIAGGANSTLSAATVLSSTELYTP